MGSKIKHSKINLGFGVAIILLAACNFFTESISPSEKTPTSLVPDNPTATNTRVPFKPGDPTATPLGSDITYPNFINGVEAWRAGNYEESLALLTLAIESNPDLAPPYQYRGLTYWSLGNCTAGLSDEEKALSIDPNYAAALPRGSV